MIKLQDINLSFGDQVVFNDISCNISTDLKLGLVGRNGSGKSTLLKAIAGTQVLDSGTVSLTKGMSIGYMPQEVTLQSEKTIYEETLSVFPELSQLFAENEKLENDLSDEVALERYATVQQKLSELNADLAQTKTKKILTGLGFSQEKMNTPVSSLSVGWKMRVILAKLLLQDADFYLFDEPTNHLDIVAKDWFLYFLKQARFGFMLVCHDRYFLDHLCTKIFELELGQGTLYSGNYTLYLQQKKERDAALLTAYERQKKDRERKMKTIERFRYSASKAKMAQSMIKALEREEIIEVHNKERVLSFSFPTIQRSGKVVLKVEEIAHAFGDKQVFQNVSFEIERGEKVAIVAPNGVGKTTLFNVITGRLPSQKGEVTLGYNVLPALFEQDQDTVLNKENSILQEVESACKDSAARQLVRKFLGAFLFSGDDVDKRVSVLSGGEKNRVAMVKVLLQNANLLLLDEPTNHLDLQSKSVLVNALQQFPGTILFVSHDRDFLDHLATRIIELRLDGATSYSGNYESYVYHKAKEREGNKPDLAAEAVVSKKQVTSNNKEQYLLRKEIGKLEKKIEKLEIKIQGLNEELGTLKYGIPAFTQTFDELQKAQDLLDETVESWEELQG